MKITQSISFLLVIALMTSTLLLPTFLVFAEESDPSADSSTSADGASLTKVDAGNALNAPGDARATDPADSDGDGYGDTAIREGGRTIEAGDIPETLQQQDGDDDSDGSADAATTATGDLTPIFPPGPRAGAQASDGDLDEDGYGDAAAIEPDNSDEDSAKIGPPGIPFPTPALISTDGNESGHYSMHIDKATPKLLEALSLDATTPLLYQGISIQVTADSCGSETDDDCDDTEEQLPSASFGIQVSGVEVRGWNPDQKSAVRTQASEVTTIETPSDFGIWLADKVLTDESITEADVTSDEVVVKYNAKTRLLGFIPMTIPVTATLKGQSKATAEAQAELPEIPALDGSSKTAVKTSDSRTETEVELDYPWYGFLLSKNSVSEQIVSDTLEVGNNYQASQKKVAKFKAGKALADTVK